MDMKKMAGTLVVRLDPGEDIVTSLTEIARKENIRLATVSAIGAVNDIVVGLFNPVSKKYTQNEVKDNFEIVSLAGNISTMKGETYLHLHMAAADVTGKVVGGHLNKAIVSATAEVFINVIEGEVDREYSETIGLNLLRL